MENLQGINSAQNVQFKGRVEKAAEQNYATAPQQIENGDEKLKKALIGLGVIGATGIALAVALKKGKVHKLSDINFNKGIATIGEDGKKFSGKVADNLKNGDKITMVYKDGVLKSSQRTGKVNFEKIYTANESGEKIVKKIVDGAEQEINITKKVNETKDSIQKLKDKVSSTSADSALPKGASAAGKTAKTATTVAKKGNNIVTEDVTKTAGGKLKVEVSEIEVPEIDSSNLVQRTNFLRKGTDGNVKFKVNSQNYKALKGVGADRISSLDDDFLELLLKNEKASENINALTNFSPKRLEAIMQSKDAKNALVELCNTPSYDRKASKLLDFLK